MVLYQLKKMLILILGGTVLLFGLVLIFLPGPSCIVIPAGLAILALEFSWARNLLKKTQKIMGGGISQWAFWKGRGKNPQDKLPDLNADSKIP